MTETYDQAVTRAKDTNRSTTFVSWAGSGLVVYLIDADGNMAGMYSHLADACGNELEKFVGALARRVAELESALYG